MILHFLVMVVTRTVFFLRKTKVTSPQAANCDALSIAGRPSGQDSAEITSICRVMAGVF
jgi:hypothetical protein